MISRKIQTILILSTLVLSTLIEFPLLPKANATTSSCTAPIANCVFVDPPTLGVATTGTTVKFNVKVANIDQFNGFDLSVATDVNALTGLSISQPSAGTGVPGLGSYQEHAGCIDGTPATLASGLGLCTVNDGPGIVHYAVTSSPLSVQGSSGTLFSITYTAQNIDPGTFLSVVNTVIANGGTTPATSVPISTKSAVYGTPFPDFVCDASSPVDQNSNTLVPGSEGSSALVITGAGGFLDTLALSLGPITPANTITDFLSPTSVFVPAGGNAAASIPITVPLSTAPGTYSQTVTASGQNTGISHTCVLSIVVGSAQGVGLTCGSDISVVQGTRGANAIGITSQNGLFGGVFLSTSTASGVGLTATTDPASVTIPAGGSEAAVLYVTADASAPLGTSMVTLTGSFGTGSNTCSINVTVLAAGSADFTLSSSDVSLIAIRGVKYTSTITVGNLAGFAGTVSTSVVVLPLVDKGPSVTVSAVSGGTATLTFSSPAANVLATQLLTYKVVVIGRSGSQAHAVQVTYTLEDFGVQARGSSNFPEFVLIATECNAGKLSFGSLNGFSGVVAISRFRMVNINTGDLGFPTGVSFSLNYSVNGPFFTADSTHNDILGSKVTVASGSFVAGTLTLCTTTDTPGGEYQLQIRGTTVVNGVKVTNRKNIFVQINSFDLVPSTSFLVVTQGAGGNNAPVGISIVGSFVEDLCCSAGFGTFPFLDFVSLTAAVVPNSVTSTRVTVSFSPPGPYLTTDLINPMPNLVISVGGGGQGGLFTITVTGVAQHTPALHRSTTIVVSVPSPIVQMPTFTLNTSPGLATFTATVTNTGTTAQFVQVVCSVASRTPGGSIYSPQSTVVALAAGATTTITFTQTTTAQDSGQLFNFQCGVNFGTSADALLFVSKDKGNGAFKAS